MRVLVEFEKRPRLFSNPEKIIVCRDPVEIPKTFEKMENALSAGFSLAGFLSYESGYSFEEKLLPLCPDDRALPLIQMGCFTSFDVPKSSPEPKTRGHLFGYHENESYPSYAKHIGIIRDHIRDGDVYQITYCHKKKFRWSGSPEFIYRYLKKTQPVPYPSMIQDGRFSILSLSPELFFMKKGRAIMTKPMKGTWPRGRNFLTDLFELSKFRNDEKNRAENLMITDLLRNDLGRIGRNVRVPELFGIRAYKTCRQMTSTVTAEIRPEIPLIELFGALFPSGSVTGAPKLRAMEIIRSLEQEPREIYTGAIGYITPDREMQFSVPIRTLLLKDDFRGEMGVGGGIVWDSTPEGEWDESRLKSAFLEKLVRG